MKGTVFLEVPVSADIQELTAPEGVKVVWLPRNGQAHGAPTIVAVREHFGLEATVELAPAEAVDPDLWETPTHSSSGEATTQPRRCRHTRPPPVKNEHGRVGKE